jgi:hypothetical protein
LSGAGGAGGRGPAGMGWTPSVPPPSAGDTRSIGANGYVGSGITNPEAKPQTPLTQGATTPTSPVSSYLFTQATLPTTPSGGTPYNMPPPPSATPKPYIPPPPSTRRDPTGTGLTRDTAWGIGGYGTTTGAGGSGGFFRNSPSKIGL